MAGLDRHLAETASQTAGPYVHIGLAPKDAGFDIYDCTLGADIAGPHAKGERIRVEGQIIDGMGAPIKDALLEIWQANADGHYAHRNGGGQVEQGFHGWGRVTTDFDTGTYGFDTVKPGATHFRDGQVQAPHLNIWIVARGINIGLRTRMYFQEDAEAHGVDPVLKTIEWPHRRTTLIAPRSGDAPLYRFDIHLQGDAETVFFDV